jgi:acyl-CoA thioesterase-1
MLAGVALLAFATVPVPMAGAAEATPVLLVVGDSISAGYGLPQGAGWVALLTARLHTERYPYRVVNASITGDTTAGGRTRLPAALKRETPAIVIIELGGNDGLRGGDLASTRANLDAMVVDAHRAGAKVLLVGTQLPPNYGPAYTHDYAAIFSGVARTQKAALVPTLFEGFGDRNDMFQSDRIHPAAAAQPIMLDTVWKTLQPMLARAK